MAANENVPPSVKALSQFFQNNDQQAAAETGLGQTRPRALQRSNSTNMSHSNKGSNKGSKGKQLEQAKPNPSRVGRTRAPTPHSRKEKAKAGGGSGQENERVNGHGAKTSTKSSGSSSRKKDRAIREARQARRQALSSVRERANQVTDRLSESDWGSQLPVPQLLAQTTQPQTMGHAPAPDSHAPLSTNGHFSIATSANLDLPIAQQLTKMRTRAETAELRNLSLSEQLEVLRHTSKETKEENIQLAQCVKLLKADVEQMCDECEEVCDQSVQYHKDSMRLKAKLASSNHQLDEAQKREATALADVQKLKLQLQDKSDDIQGSLQSYNDNMDELRQLRAHQQRAMLESDIRIRELEEQLAALQDEQASGETERAALSRQVGELQQAQTETRARNTGDDEAFKVECEEVIQELENRIIQDQTQMDGLELLIKEGEAEASTLTRKLLRTQAHLAKARAAIAKLTHSNQKMQAQQVKLLKHRDDALKSKLVLRGGMGQQLKLAFKFFWLEEQLSSSLNDRTRLNDKVVELERQARAMADQKQSWKSEMSSLEREVRHASGERAEAVLRMIDNQFNGNLNLMSPGRELLKRGQLNRISSHQKELAYEFFLFTDIIIYAKVNRHPRRDLKPHRVLHLSLCRLIDFQADPVKRIEPVFRHSFKIQSPQKSFKVSFKSAREKHDWLTAILQQIKLVSGAASGVQVPLAALDGVGTASRANQELNDTVDSKQNSSMEQTDDMLGDTLERVDKDTEGELTDQASDCLSSASLGPAHERRAKDHCRLCIRSFTVFRRRTQCRCCKMLMCSDCCQQKYQLSGKHGKTKRVCDACHGGLSGMVALSGSLEPTVDHDG